jgi:hypothetical protein
LQAAAAAAAAVAGVREARRGAEVVTGEGGVAVVAEGEEEATREEGVQVEQTTSGGSCKVRLA